MPKDVVIIGAGGHAKVIADIVLCSGDNLIGFLDDGMKHGEGVYKKYEVIGKVSDCLKYKDKYFIVAIGNNKIRGEVVEKYSYLMWYTAIHPKAVIADTVKIGDGTVIMAGVVINADSIIGRHCILNTLCSIDHDNFVGDYAHVSPGAKLAGTVTIGDYSWVCAGVTIINNIDIAENVVLGAGSTVIDDINEAGVYIGTPARKKI